MARFAYCAGVFLIAVAGFAQDQPAPAGDKQPVTADAAVPPQTPAPPNATLKVEPGAPVIKSKDIYEASGYFHPFVRMPQYVFRDQKAAWTSPFHTSKVNAKWWVIFGAGAGALIATDKHTVKALPNSQTQISVSTWSSRFGAAYSVIPISTAFYIVGTHSHQERLRETGLMGFEALLDANIAVQAFKLIADRARPYEGNGTGRFENSSLGRWNSSFPSGHAINSWALASVVAHQYHHSKVIPLIAYGLASTVSLSRVGARQHFPGDIVIGAGLGWFIGDYVFAKRHNASLDEISH